MSSRLPLSRAIRYELVYWLTGFFIWISRFVPRWLWLLNGAWLGELARLVTPKTRRLIRRHIALALGNELSPHQQKKLVRKVYRYWGMNGFDLVKSYHVGTLARLERFLTTKGFEHYEKAVAEKRGVIFLTCHLGAFDMQVTNMALRGLNPHIIGTKLKNEKVNRLLLGYRNRYGAIAVERGKETFRLLKTLKSGGSVALLIDQDLKVKSRMVNFFGMPAATPIGASVLALKTGAALLPTYIYLGADKYQHMQIHPEVVPSVTGDEEKDVVALTQKLSDIIEGWVRQHPEQWVWNHRRWKTKPGEVIL
jgi:KDO2-lipid IV(A) lauroyltransferase